MNQCKTPILKISKDIKSNNYYYYKVEKAKTEWGAIEKSAILMLQYWMKELFDSVPKFISYFS